MPSPNTSTLLGRWAGPPYNRVFVQYYERPLFMIYWFPVITLDDRRRWVMRVSYDWNGRDQCWTDVDCPYRKLAAEFGIIPRKSTARQEDAVTDNFLVELLEDAQQDAIKLREILDPSRLPIRS